MIAAVYARKSADQNLPDEEKASRTGSIQWPRRLPPASSGGD
jgi:hypothetical protein